LRAIRRAVATRPSPGPRGLTVTDREAVLTASGLTNVALDVDPAVQVHGQSVVRVLGWADDPAAFARAWLGGPPMMGDA
jgi:hypothetical protein